MGCKPLNFVRGLRNARINIIGSVLCLASVLPEYMKKRFVGQTKGQGWGMGGRWVLPSDRVSKILDIPRGSDAKAISRAYQTLFVFFFLSLPFFSFMRQRIYMYISHAILQPRRTISSHNTSFYDENNPRKRKNKTKNRRILSPPKKNTFSPFPHPRIYPLP